MSDSLRIGIFTNAYRPLISGVVNSIDLIRKGLKRRGHFPFIFAPEYPGYTDEHAGVYRFRSLQLSNKVDFPLPIPFSTRLFPLISRMRLDIIHTHHPFLLGEVGAYFARKLDIPLVYTFHTQYEKYAHYIPFNQTLVKSLAKNSVVSYTRKCDLIIAPSPSIVGLLGDYAVTTPVVTLQNAIDVDRFAAGEGDSVRAEFEISDKALVFIYAGRIGLEKNLSFMLRAFAAALESESVRHREIVLLVVGDGPQLEELKALAKELGIWQQVIFTGPVDYARMPDYYAAADAFLITSTTEVKPLVVLEAMAGGLPVLAVSACGTEDTVTHEQDGWLCACEESEFAALICRAIERRERLSQMGERARNTVQKYSIEAYTERLLGYYAALIRKKRRQEAEVS